MRAEEETVLLCGLTLFEGALATYEVHLLGNEDNVMEQNSITSILTAWNCLKRPKCKYCQCSFFS